MQSHFRQHNMLRSLKRSFTSFRDKDLTQMIAATSSIPIQVHIQHHWPFRATSRRMARNGTLSPATVNPLGFYTAQARKSGTLLDFVCNEKEKHPDKIIFVRVGEFFEAFGVDAVLLVEHAGLNPMGQKARAGCPRGNVQQTLDGLTSVGLTVAVYEEVEGTALTKAGLKQRYLAQVVSPASSTYFVGSSLGVNDIEFRESSSFLGLQVSSRGSTASSSVNDTVTGARAEGSIHYTIYEANIEEKFVRVNERLTEDAARSIIEQATSSMLGTNGNAGIRGHSDSENMNGTTTNSTLNATGSTLYYAGAPNTDTTVSKIPTRTRNLIASGTTIERLAAAEQDARMFLPDMLARIAIFLEQPELADVKSYRIVGTTTNTFNLNKDGTKSTALATIRPRPLYSPTAQQLGLLPSPQVPDLVHSLLPRNDAPASTRSFLRRWIMRPPPPYIADEMSSLLHALEEVRHAIPTVRTTLTTRKLVALCSARGANASMFRELHHVLEATLSVLIDEEEDAEETDENKENKEVKFQNMTKPLVNIVSFECGVNIQNAYRLKLQGYNAKMLIESIVDLDEEGYEHYEIQEREKYDQNNIWHVIGPCMIKNETECRNAIKTNASHSTSQAFELIDQCRNNLIHAIQEDFGCHSIEKDGKYDTINNKIYLMKRKTKKNGRDQEDQANQANQANQEDQENQENEKKWISPKDRNGRKLINRWTTEKVEDANSEYINACDQAKNVAREELRHLCDAFVSDGHMLCSVCAVVMNEILLTSTLHVREYTRRKWSLPYLESVRDVTTHDTDKNVQLLLKSMFPYWINHADAVPNDVELCGQWVVTGPNMSGKSTLLRSVTACALLANCGLAVPAIVHSEHPIPRLDGYFLRTNGSDCPAEGLSAFALEADDIRILIRDVTSRSLAAVDELGRGTAPKEGAAIVGAVLEELDQRGCLSIFATHLHEELGILPLNLINTENKVLRVVEEDQENRYENENNGLLGGGPVKYIYCLESGICENSHSLATAAYHGVDSDLIQRATELRLAGEEVLQERMGMWKQENEKGSNEKVETLNEKDEKNEKNEKDEKDEMNPSDLDLETAIQLVNDISNQMDDVVMIESEWDPPPTIADEVACVYVLEVSVSNGSTGSAITVPTLYIGETEHLADRIGKHRYTFGKQIKIAVFPMKNGAGKTEARRTEARAIVEARRAGFVLHNISS